ncbi:MAG TPA: PQQ-binding-like beta-propeller repeat protein [Vicinamibacterales bacterium]|nr:PQQ-binding-like beta-propeller repeat protein [Vicinamibacterales bacterium]
MLIAPALLAVLLGASIQNAQPAPPAQTAQPSPLVEELWAAAREGDAARVAKALDQGADVNAGNRYKATALMFAADKGHVDVIRLLLDRGADINVQDTFYRFRAVNMAMMNGHHAAALLLLERGSEGAGQVLGQAAAAGHAGLVQAALKAGELTRMELQGALAAARRGKHEEIAGAIEKRLADLPAEPVVTVSRPVLQSYVGSYRNEAANTNLRVALEGDQLTVIPTPGQPPLTLVPTSDTTFRVAEAPNVTLRFAGRGGMVESVAVVQGNSTQVYPRVTDAAPAPSAAEKPAEKSAATPAPGAPAPAPRAARTAARPWPAFRGANAAGNGDGQGAVSEWDVATNRNVRWKTPIPGFTTASPIVWNDRVFVVTAISSKGDRTFRTGLYGDVAPVDDLSEHTWKIYCLDKASGKILWEQTAHVGVPKVKRHTKSAQANSTPVTDGTRVVALFGSVGVLAAWDMNGKPLWKQDIGVLDSGWFFDPTYQWGHSSSPIIHDGKVIVQADVQKNSFIAAYDVATGRQVWKTERDEISTWGTPTIFKADGRDVIVTNGPKIRGYDARTGELVWTLGPNSEVTVGTPVVGDGLVYVTGGYPPVRPIYAVKPTAAGEITMPKEGAPSDAIAWSNTAGTYIPTPIYYDGILYTVNNDGIVTAYDGKTGERIYRARVGGGGSFSASPVAADGKLYFANEDGDVIVVRAGRSYEELAKNPMKEIIMGTPAISDGLIIIRTLEHVYAVGEKK